MKKTDIRTGINRRQAFQYLSASSATLLLGQSRLSLGQVQSARAVQPVRIGALLPVSGDADAYARQMRMGIETAARRNQCYRRRAWPAHRNRRAGL